MAQAEFGKLQEAVADFSKAILKDAGFAEAYDHRAGVLLALGQFERALGDLDEAIWLDPTLGSAYARRAIVNTVLGNDTEALKDVASAVELGIDAAELNQTIGAVKEERDAGPGANAAP